MNFDFSTPYASARLPQFARNVVSTSHPLAAQAGLRMMLKGGNAVDAAIAAAAAITITEPVSNGLGSDAFCILWDGQKLHGLNASGPAPQAWTPEYFHKKYGTDAVNPPKRGWDSVTVPGAVGAWAALSERFGKLPFADLMEPAIEIAERGYLLPVVVQQKWEAATPLLQSLPGFAEGFLPWGRAPNVGELFQFKAAARGLRAIAETKGRAFYEGEIAEALVKFSNQHGGAMTLQDLAQYRPEWVEPISQNYHGYTLNEIPPNGQGIAALIALGILENFDLPSLKVDGIESQHLQIEAMKLAFADVYRYVADPRNMEVTPAQMLDPAYLKSRAKLIDMKKAQDFKARFEILRFLHVNEFGAALQIGRVEHLRRRDFHVARIGHIAVHIGKGQLHGFDLQMLRFNTVHFQAGQIKVFQNAQSDQSCNALTIGWNFVERVAMVILRNGLDPFRAVLRQVLQRHGTAMLI